MHFAGLSEKNSETAWTIYLEKSYAAAYHIDHSIKNYERKLAEIIKFDSKSFFEYARRQSR